MDHTVGLKSPTIAGGLFSVGMSIDFVFLFCSASVKARLGSTNLESTMTKWISGAVRTLSFLSESGSVAERWKFFLAPG